MQLSVTEHTRFNKHQHPHGLCSRYQNMCRCVVIWFIPHMKLQCYIIRKTEHLLSYFSAANEITEPDFSTGLTVQQTETSCGANTFSILILDQFVDSFFVDRAVKKKKVQLFNYIHLVCIICQVKKLAQMFSATTVQATAVRPKKKHREEPKVVKCKLKMLFSPHWGVVLYFYCTGSHHTNS